MAKLNSSGIKDLEAKGVGMTLVSSAQREIESPDWPLLQFRNPDLDLSGPWCYTTANETRWEYCEIDVCKDDDSFIVFTNFNADEKSSHLV